MYDAVIVGGGPAGLYAAARLCAAGFQTAILEEHAAIGEPVHCTGVLAVEAFSQFQLPRRALLNELTTARFWSPAGREVIYRSADVEAVVIDRRLFDRDLSDLAQASGVSIDRGARVVSVQIENDGVLVRTSESEVRARACILACGASYALHRQVGLDMPSLFLNTAQLEVDSATPGDVELHFGSEIAPKGFGWVVPVDHGAARRARIGVMCEQDAPLFFERLTARVADRWGIAPSAPLKPRQKVLPLGPISRTYSDRLLAIGDAAGIVKPTTGGGIYYSLLSASLAAEVLAQALSANRLEATRLRVYQSRWRDLLADEFQAQLSLRHVAHRMTDDDIEQLFELARTDGVMPIVRRTASFNRHRRLILELLKHPPVRHLLLRHLAF